MKNLTLCFLEKDSKVFEKGLSKRWWEDWPLWLIGLLAGFNDFFIFATFVLYQYQITMVNHQFTSPEITYINSNYFNGKNLDKFLHSTYGQQKSTAMLAGTLEEP